MNTMNTMTGCPFGKLSYRHFPQFKSTEEVSQEEGVCSN